jgi:hypothetical protein
VVSFLVAKQALTPHSGWVCSYHFSLLPFPIVTLPVGGSALGMQRGVCPWSDTCQSKVVNLRSVIRRDLLLQEVGLKMRKKSLLVQLSRCPIIFKSENELVVQN